MKPYPLVDDFVRPVLQVAVPRVPRLMAPGGAAQELKPCHRRIKRVNPKWCPVLFSSPRPGMAPRRPDAPALAGGGGHDLRAAVSAMAETGCHPNRALIDSLRSAARRPEGGALSLSRRWIGRFSALPADRVPGGAGRRWNEQRIADMKQAMRKQSVRGVRPRRSVTSLRFVGMWADRDEMKDSARWIREQRTGWMRRGIHDGGR